MKKTSTFKNKFWNRKKTARIVIGLLVRDISSFWKWITICPFAFVGIPKTCYCIIFHIPARMFFECYLVFVPFDVWSCFGGYAANSQAFIKIVKWFDKLHDWHLNGDTTRQTFSQVMADTSEHEMCQSQSVTLHTHRHTHSHLMLFFWCFICTRAVNVIVDALSLIPPDQSMRLFYMAKWRLKNLINVRQ